MSVSSVSVYFYFYFYFYFSIFICFSIFGFLVDLRKNAPDVLAPIRDDDENKQFKNTNDR